MLAGQAENTGRARALEQAQDTNRARNFVVFFMIAATIGVVGYIIYYAVRAQQKKDDPEK